MQLNNTKRKEDTRTQWYMKNENDCISTQKTFNLKHIIQNGSN